VKLRVSLDGDGLGGGPAVNETRAKALDDMTRTTGRRGGKGRRVHDPAGDRLGHDRKPTGMVVAASLCICL